MIEIASFLIKGIVVNYGKKFFYNLLWQAMLEPSIMGVAWGIGRFVSASVWGVRRGVEGFFSIPFINNLIKDIVKVPEGMFELIDNTVNSFLNSTNEKNPDGFCLKCEVVKNKSYPRAVFDNGLSIAIAAYLANHFYKNLSSSFTSFHKYNDFRNKSELESIQSNSYEALSTLGICTALQCSAIIACTFTAMSASQVPKNKFVFASVLAVAELAKRGHDNYITNQKTGVQILADKLSSTEEMCNEKIEEANKFVEKAKTERANAVRNLEDQQALNLTLRNQISENEHKQIATITKLNRLLSLENYLTTTIINFRSRIQNFDGTMQSMSDYVLKYIEPVSTQLLSSIDSPKKGEQRQIENGLGM